MTASLELDPVVIDIEVPTPVPIDGFELQPVHSIDVEVADDPTTEFAVVVTRGAPGPKGDKGDTGASPTFTALAAQLFAAITAAEARSIIGAVGTDADLILPSSGGSTTPRRIALGTSYGTNTQGTRGNLKLALWDDGNAGYGSGVSLDTLEYQVPGTAKHRFYVGGTAQFTVDSTGVSAPNLSGTNTGDQDLSGKRDLVTGTAKVYVVDGAGTQTGIAYASTATASTFIRRDANARAQFADPSAPADAATKNYVDTLGATYQPRFMTGTCSTASATAAKTVTLDSPWASYTPTAGDYFLVTFTNSSAISNVTLAINGTTARNLRTETDGQSYTSLSVAAGAAMYLRFDGTYYRTQNCVPTTLSGGDLANPANGTAGLISGTRAEFLLASEASVARTLANKTIDSAQLTTAASLAQFASLYSYNTSDQTTNYERVRHYWTSNTYMISAESGGTGVGRDIKLQAGSSSLLVPTSTGLTARRDNTAFTGAGILNVSSTGLMGIGGTQIGLMINPAVSQSSTAGYTMLLVNPTESTTGSGQRLLADFQVGGSSKTRIDSAGIHYFSVGAGTVSYNTADETTNYERVSTYWASNQYVISSAPGGTGTQRAIKLQSHGSLTLAPNATGGGIQLNDSTAGVGSTVGIASVTGTLSGASSIQNGLMITPTLTQSSTASYTALLVNPTETSTGSGSKLLADFQVGGSTKLSIDNAGVLTFGGDSTLYRSSANIMQLNSRLVATVASGFAFSARTSGDNNDRFNVNSGGTLNFGPGNAATDVNLYRAAAGYLRTDGGFIIGGVEAIMTGGSTAWYNTSDTVTNYERVRAYWNSNTFVLASEAGGTGSYRPLQLNGAGTQLTMGSNGGVFQRGNTISPLLLQITSSGMQHTTAVQAALTIDPTINQSGSGGYVMLKINPTESAIGSGSRLLADFQVGGVSKASIDTTGAVTVATPTANGHATTKSYVDNRIPAAVVITTTQTLPVSPNAYPTYLLGADAIVTMPTAVGNTTVYTVKNIDTTAKTLLTTSSQTIDGSTSISLLPYQSVDLISDGSNWWVC